MKYLIRVNPKCLDRNPLTGTTQADFTKLWEVEQCANKDSEKVIWHCAEVRVGDKTIKELLFEKYPSGEHQAKDVEIEAWGIITRGGDDALIISGGKHDVGW